MRRGARALRHVAHPRQLRGAACHAAAARRTRDGQHEHEAELIVAYPRLRSGLRLRSTRPRGPVHAEEERFSVGSAKRRTLVRRAAPYQRRKLCARGRRLAGELYSAARSAAAPAMCCATTPRTTGGSSSRNDAHKMSVVSFSAALLPLPGAAGATSCAARAETTQLAGVAIPRRRRQSGPGGQGRVIALRDVSK